MAGIRYRKTDGYKYLVYENYSIPTPFKGHPCNCPFVSLDAEGLLTLYAGFLNDGPSGPVPDAEEFMRGAMLHDGFYALMRHGSYPNDHKHRCQVDEFMRDVWVEDGVEHRLADLMCLAVNTFAAYAAEHVENDPGMLIYTTRG